MIKLTSQITSGHLSDKTRRILATFMSSLEGKKVEITISEFKRKRSIPQNAFFHGVILPLVWSELFIKNGHICSTEDVKTYLKGEVGQLYCHISTPDGEVIQILRSTTELTTKEWELWLEQIRAWAADYELILPMPNEKLT